jgi:hypothetical protein
MLGMMDNLYDLGRLDILRDIANGVISPQEAFEFWRTHELEKIPNISALKTLDHLEEWLKDKPDIADSTRQSYTDHLDIFLNFAGRNNQVSDLPLYLERYKRHCHENKTHRSFDYVRSVLQSYLSDVKLVNLWDEVKAIGPFKKKRKRKGVKWLPHQLDEIAEELPKQHRDILLSMTLNGMGPYEYWEKKWSIEQNCIRIEGTKTDYRDRLVPKLFCPVLPQVQRLAFLRALKKLGDYLPYDCRRTYAFLLLSAKIPRARRLAYMGHAGSSVLDLYEEHEVEDYLRKDHDIIVNYFSDERIDAAMPDVVKEIYGDKLVPPPELGSQLY